MRLPTPAAGTIAQNFIELVMDKKGEGLKAKDERLVLFSPFAFRLSPYSST
jgi:hypothetical protein